MRQAIPTVLLLAVVSGCKLSEVVPTPPSPPFLVVHGVLNAREGRQFVTVESSNGAQNDTSGVSGAIVELTHLDPVSCPSPTVQLGELAFPQPGVPTRGIYLTRDLCDLQAGDRVALRVETPDGKVVTGTTRVPGAAGMEIRAGSSSGGFPPATILMDRTRDSLSITIDPLGARALNVEVVRDDVGGFLTFHLATDSMAMRIAGNLIDPFGDDGRTVFRAGAYYLLTVAAIDANYFDFLRSASDPFTGRGFINHLDGGVGVFGSVSPYTFELKVVAPQTDEREGIYRLTGTMGGDSIDITWDLYRDGLSLAGDGFSGFVGGRWAEGPISTSANVSIIDGAFNGVIYGTTSEQLFPGQVGNAYVVSGTRAPRGQPFALEVTYTRNGAGLVDVLTAVQLPGP